MSIGILSKEQLTVLEINNTRSRITYIFRFWFIWESRRADKKYCWVRFALRHFRVRGAHGEVVEVLQEVLVVLHLHIDTLLAGACCHCYWHSLVVKVLH